MWLNLVAIAVFGIFVALGAWRGALATGLGIASLLGSYAAAVFLGPALVPVVNAALGLGPLLALPVAGTVAFFGAYLLLGAVSSLLSRLGESDDESRSPLDRFLGGTFGAARGLFLAVMVVYLAMWLDALRATGSAAVIPEVGNSAAAYFTSELVEGTLAATLDPEDAASRVTARLAARPAVAAVELQGVIDDPGFTRLREDRGFWSAVEHGKVDAALDRSSFVQVQRDAQLRHKLANLALVPDEAATDPAIFRDAVRDVLRQVGPRIAGLRNDPELQRLMNDPEVAAMIQRGDTLGLLTHPGFRQVVERVTSQPASEPASD